MMNMLYDSDAFVVVQVLENASPDDEPPPEIEQIGFELVDKRSNLCVYLSGRFAAVFVDQIKRWQETTPEQKDVEAVLEMYASIMTQPLVIH